MMLKSFVSFCFLQFQEFTLEDITNYLSGCEKELDNKAKNLYKERYLQTVRVATENNKFYIHAQCHAEMKKSVVYNVDVIVDSNAVVCECQCECAAGMGPEGHCKHVCAVLYGLYLFSQTKEIIVQETCTEQLQAFHRSKRFKGSPLKSSAMNLRTQSSASSVFTKATFDPRPHNLRNSSSYPAYFQSTCLNFSHCSPRMPILQLIPPANLQAVASDHDYLLDTPADVCLRNLLENEHPISIELKTRGQSLSPAWAEERTRRIQSSTFGRICKATVKTNLDKLALSMISPRKFTSASVRYGCKFESVAVNKYEEMRKIKTTECGIFVCPTYPYLGSSVWWMLILC
jgi:hypothetical protein